MALLNPRSIAVIGASADEKKVGHAILRNLLTQGYRGEVYPVNPKGGEILGKKVFPTVSEIPSTVDLAIIATPTPTVLTLAEECGKKGVKGLIIITAGFSETGTTEGKGQEEKLREITKQYHMQLVGPNCLGIIRPGAGMNASFAEDMPQPGTIALLSQSGAVVVALLDAAKDLAMRFSTIISMGNKTTMDECDFLALCERDEETKIIGLYLESIEDGRRFREVTALLGARKPIVLLKSGVSARGSRAVSSHTGALAGSDAAIKAICAQTGIRRAYSTQEFLDLLRTLASQPPLLSPRIAIITNAGGPGILATDAAECEKLILASLGPGNRDELRKVLPAASSIENPIDVLGDALADRYAAALTACGKDQNIDGIVAVLTPQRMTPVQEIAQAIIDVSAKYPLMPVVASFMGGESVHEAVSILQAHGIPNFTTPETAVHALASLQPPPSYRYNDISIYHKKARGQELLKGCGGLLSEEKVQELFRLYGVPLPRQALAHTGKEAWAIAEQIGFPVIAKVSSPEIIHKTDVSGIKANLQSGEEVKQAYEEILANVQKHAPHATIRGVLIQKFLPLGNEFIVGALRDPTFGPLVMVGLGGIYTELFRDTSFRLAPISEEEAYTMLQELKSWKVLTGLRGKGPSDIASLASLLATVSQLISGCSEIHELDLNPVIVSEQGVTIADAKIIL